MKPRFHRRAQRPSLQMQLALPPVPRESPLWAAFRRAELGQVGLDFRTVHGDPRAARLLRNLASAYEHGNDLAARAFARALVGMRKALR